MTPVNELKLVIFDCDGVLVDSEQITNRVFSEMLNELGLSVTLDDMFEKFVGRSTAYCYDLIGEMLQRPVPADFMEQCQQRTNAALSTELKAVDGIEYVIDALSARRVDFCVASNGTHEKMKTTLGITGLLSRFANRLFSVTEVARGKPAPDVFLHAARQRGAAPSQCHVVEDTPTGVRAGVAAGMRVYGYCAFTPRHRLMEAGAHVTVDDMRKLPELWFDDVSRQNARQRDG